jgi:uncharacterized lipoprotein YmbA
MESAAFSYQVLVRITRFDTSLEGEANLEVRWEIRVHNEGDVLVIHRFRFQNLPNEQGYEGMVSAMSQNLEDFSRTIATTIQSLHR